MVTVVLCPSVGLNVRSFYLETSSESPSIREPKTLVNVRVFCGQISSSPWHCVFSSFCVWHFPAKIESQTASSVDARRLYDWDQERLLLTFDFKKEINYLTTLHRLHFFHKEKKTFLGMGLVREIILRDIIMNNRGGLLITLHNSPSSRLSVSKLLGILGSP